MKRFSRRLFSILLAVSIVFGLSGMTAFAAQTEEDAPATIAADADSYNVKYAVCLWAINQDTDENGHTLGLTFGPATGADYTDTYNAHLTRDAYDAGGICLHWMSWEEIAEQSRIDPTAFEACLENGCTHSVDITLNDTLLDASYAGQMADGDGAGMLSESIGGNYRIWNSANNVSDGYPASQVRTVLNGKDDLMGGNARYALTEEDCLFSCFPAELRDEIVPKAVKSDTLYVSQQEENNKTTYDNLWLFSGKELYAASGTTSDPVIRSLEGDLYQRSELLGITTSDYAALVNYDEEGKTRSWWTRSMTQANNTQLYLVMTGGVPNYYDATYTTVGLAPGFCLAGPTDKTDLETAITEVEETMRGLNKSDYTAASWEALEEALAGAKAMIEEPDVTQAQVDAARTTLLNALEDLEPVTEQAFAVYSAEDDSLSFYTGFAPTEGDSYQGKAATTVYTDVDSIAASDTGDIPWYDLRESVTSVVVDSTFSEAQPISLAYWFDEFAYASFDGLEYMDTSDVTTLYYTFRDCKNLTRLDLSGWDVSNVRNMNSLFYDCESLTSVGDLSGWDTSQNTTMFSMFTNCSALTGVNLSGWNTAQVVNMSSLFYGCRALTSVGDLSGWDTSKNTTLYGTFYNCSSLTGMGDLSGWDTSNVTDMQHTFRNCSGLTTLDLSGWDTTSVTANTNFATGCSALQWVKIGGKTTVFTLGQCVSQQNWYDSATNGKLVSSNYLQDVKTAGQYWTYTENTGGGGSGVATVEKINGVWTYTVDGKPDYTYTGFGSNNNGKWYVEKGIVTFAKQDILKDTTGGIGTKGDWYYVIDSKVQESFTGLSNFSNASGWWYIVKGKVDFSHNGVDKNNNGWWYVTGGKVQFGYTGVANYKNQNGWWYIKEGKVDFTYNGRASNKNGTWNVAYGKVVF
ncbi:MAG: BspA family leucine-rich repeat surface protein [Bacteroidales bacterium]|nr:BspA family leucine-rich repeat surface protein [Bacteroidales bacterium]